MEIDEDQYPLLVFLCILASAVLLLLAWSIGRFFHGPDYNAPRPMSPEQAAYMRETRLRNVRWLAAKMGRRDLYRQIDDSLRDGGAAW